MRRITIFIFALIFFSACQNYKKNAEQLTALRDSLVQETSFKDASIADLLRDFNEIQANLTKIKEVEKIVTIQTNAAGELSSDQKQKILEDITLLNGLLQKNKELTSSLQNKLKNSNYKIAQLAESIEQFQVMVNTLETEVQVKNTEITALSGEVEKLNIDISSLTEKIIFMSDEDQKKMETIETQTTQLNTAYFVYGSAKELRDFGVIEKSGGVLGIGKTPVIKKNFNHDYFTEVDIRQVDFIPLKVKKAKLISVHPLESFHFSNKKSADTLFIDNRSEFWKTSKYLVILTD